MPRTIPFLTAANVLLRLAVAALLLAALRPAAADTFTVTSTADTGGNCTATPSACTLRQAIASANAGFQSDTIAFAIPGAGPHTISPATALPTVTQSVTINGYSQPGAVANTSATGFNAVLKIRLNGVFMPTGAGLTVQPGIVVTVSGLSFTNFSGTAGGVIGRAIEIRGGGSVNIRGCAIGLRPDFVIEGNQIGVKVAAGQSGAVGIGSTGTDTVVRANRNLIAGNAMHGVLVESGSGVVSVLNNLIGTAPAGNTHLGVQSNGITIGRSGAIVRGNVLKGNDVGIRLQAPGFTVTGNLIGKQTSDAAATIAGGIGIRIEGSLAGTGVIGGSGTLGNLIARTSDDGIAHAAADIDADFALNTYIGTQRAFDLLGVNGLDTNDAGDVDTGPNGLQNSPQLVTVTRFEDAPNAPITISGTLSSLPERSFRIVFHTTSLGTLGDTTSDVTTDANGAASFGPLQVVFPGANVVQISATATLLDAGTGAPRATSELSVPTSVQTIPPPVDLVVNSTADPGDGTCNAAECTLREAIVAANGNANASSIDEITFAIPGTPETVHTIMLTGPLPELEEPTTIDGYSQPGAVPNTDASGVGSNAQLRIVLAGGAFHFNDFNNSASSITLRGLSIVGFDPPQTAGGLGFDFLNARIEGCWFGVRPDGTEVSTDVNVLMNSEGGIFGGDAPAQRNVWVNRHFLNMTRGRASNNLFGVLPDGRTAASVSVFDFSDGNGAAIRAIASSPVVVSNNVFSTPANVPAIIGRDVDIVDNAFGEAWDGSATFPLGMAVRSSVRVRIQSATHAIRNALGNAIEIDTSNLTGPILVDQPIRGGQASGVLHVQGVASVLVRAPISGTTGIGFDLRGDGVTPNDIQPGFGADGDSGPNGVQNFPELTAAIRAEGNIIVLGMLPSLPDQQFRIVLCGAATLHPTGHGDCDTVLDDQTIVTTDGDGLADFSIVVPDDAGLGFVTASASRIVAADVDEQTSELSAGVAIGADVPLFADGFE